MKGSTIKVALYAMGTLALYDAARAPRTTGVLAAPLDVDLRAGPASMRAAPGAGAAARGPHGAPVCGAMRPGPRASASESASSYARLPLAFEINRGQSPAEVAFAARGQGYGLFLTATDAVLILSAPVDAPIQRRDQGRGGPLAMLAPPATSPAAAPPQGRLPEARPTVVRMTFAGANRAPVISGLEELPGKANYFRGRDPKAWRTNIPTYAKVAYRDIYTGIDLVYYGDVDRGKRVDRIDGDIEVSQQHLEYDLIVAPQSDPSQIALSFDGVDSLEIAQDGDLILRTPSMEIRQRKPSIYQQAGASRETVDGRYILRGTRQVGFKIGFEVGFELGPYDTNRTLVIDPMLAFSSYLGGTGIDMGQRVAVDAVGHAYLTGTTTSPNFPVTTDEPMASELDEVFVAKVNPEGSALVYATYLGGSGNDRGRDVAIDSEGHAYLTGFTDSADFPIRQAVQPTFGGPLGDAFVAELSPTGDALVYATYLGGSRRDIGESIAVDRRGAAYVTGSTISSDFPTTPNAFQPALGGIDPSLDAFVTKLAPGGTALVYSTFLGGGEGDGGTGIAVNARGNAYVTGVTGSGDFPRVRPFQPLAFRGIVDAFVAKVSQDGSALVYSSNLGGDETDVGLDIAVDSFDRAIAGGLTSSDDFPTVRPLQPALSGSFDGFVTIISTAGTALAFSTYLGGTARDEITGIAVDKASHVHVVGRTFSSDFPTVNAIQASPGGNLDTFVAKIDVQKPQLLYATYLGGEADDDGLGIAADPAGSAYVIGTTQSDGFPVAHALQPGRAGGVDAFFAKISDFTVCLQDDQTGHTLQFNVASGGYQFSACGGNGARLLGTGRVARDGQLLFLVDQGLFAFYNARANSGFARIAIRQREIFAINDRNTTNNTCACQ